MKTAVSLIVIVAVVAGMTGCQSTPNGGITPATVESLSYLAAYTYIERNGVGDAAQLLLVAELLAGATDVANPLSVNQLVALGVDQRDAIMFSAFWPLVVQQLPVGTDLLENLPYLQAAARGVARGARDAVVVPAAMAASAAERADE